MSTSYLTLADPGPRPRYVITDSDGVLLLDAGGQYRLKAEFTVHDAAGQRVAVISGGAFRKRFEITADGQVTTVRPAGGLIQRFQIHSPVELLAGWSNFVASRYSITRGGVQVAAMQRVKRSGERYSIEIADGQDRVLIHLVLVVMYMIRGGGAPSGG